MNKLSVPAAAAHICSSEFFRNGKRINTKIRHGDSQFYTNHQTSEALEKRDRETQAGATTHKLM